MNLNFDYWSRLAKENPPRFEAERKQLIEDAIAQAPARMRVRLTQLQWKIDSIRSISRSPLGATIKINDMMLDYLRIMNEVWSQPYAASRRIPTASRLPDNVTPITQR